MGRRPYRTTMRPFRDSDVEVVVHWYKVPATNPRLPYPSRINSLDWKDGQFSFSPVGEVTGAEREFDGWGRIVPPVPEDHICGERGDFEFGGLYRPDLPPLERGPDGIPLCCRPAFGGLVFGGSAVIGELGDGGPAFGGSALFTSLPGIIVMTSYDGSHSYSLNRVLFPDELPQWDNQFVPAPVLIGPALTGTPDLWRVTVPAGLYAGGEGVYEAFGFQGQQPFYWYRVSGSGDPYVWRA